MNRRNFLQQGSTAAIAIAGLPIALRKLAQTSPHIYKNERVTGKADQHQFIFTLYHNAIENFATAKPEEKFIRLQASFFESASTYIATKSGEFRYSIEKTEQTDKENNLWRLTIKAEPGTPGNYEFPSNFPKTFRLRVKPMEYIEVISEKSKSLMNVPYNSVYTPPSTGDANCFLTTACVQHQHLQDDCEELLTLRQLRDNFMKQSTEGQQLVRQYGIIGPAIVQAIDGCDNKKEIYEYMYEHMICPSVMLVKRGQLQEAVNHYAKFVKGLLDKYA